MTEPTQPGVPVTETTGTPPARAARALPDEIPAAAERPVLPSRAAPSEASQATPTRPGLHEAERASQSPAAAASQPGPGPLRAAPPAPTPAWLTAPPAPLRPQPAPVLPPRSWGPPTAMPYQQRYPYPLPSQTPGGSSVVPRPQRRGVGSLGWIALAGLVLVLVLTLVAAIQTGWLHAASTGRVPNPPRPAPADGPEGPTGPSQEGPIPTYQAQVTPELSAGVVLITGMADYGRSSGSGMVLTPDGLVLTNYHVVADTQTLSVEIADTGQSYDAVLVGRNVWSDVALLQLQAASGLTTVELSERAVKTGDEVVAIGNADGGGVLLGTGGSVTALNATIWLESAFGGYGTDPMTGLIESTMGAVPGYSGGPTFDTDGQVVGVTSAGYDEVATAMVTYSIPIDSAMHIVDDILGGNETEQTRIGPGPYLGVGLGEEDVPTITGVTPGSPAELAGLTVGSTITSFNGTQVTRANALLKLMESSEPGQQVEIIWTTEYGEVREALVTLATSPLN